MKNIWKNFQRWLKENGANQPRKLLKKRRITLKNFEWKELWKGRSSLALLFFLSENQFGQGKRGV
ncbi:hypothetical protein MFLO_01150 [Listeria floridensis FSL S10-1187]|uniref:Uncharacterized protein n=1 Tax=Listeria floridensis FSL S10-1187 TaxID=1265817 RepID=A0ABP3B1S6_9LIST|nr:hypothetical protein MFLO_01150 [Listeria floridensis FSL S10-1187]